MKRKVDLVEFSDLLEEAEKLGYGWNLAHEILVKDHIPPMYELSTREIYASELKYTKEQGGWSDDSRKILQSFMDTHKLKSFILVMES
jgi:hypothetical protein